MNRPDDSLVRLAERQVLDQDLDADEARRLMAALRGGGAEAAEVRAAMRFACLLGQALGDGEDAFMRGLDARIGASSQASAFVRRIERRIPRRRTPPRPAMWIALAAALLLALIGVAWLGQADAPAHRVEGAADADIRRGAQTLHASDGAALVVGDELACTGRIAVRCRDGSRLAMRPGSRIRLLDEDRGLRFQLESGGLDAEILAQPAGRPLVIETPDAEVEVVGTRFRLAVDGPSTRLEVSVGAVRLSGRSDRRSTLVRAGENAATADGRLPSAQAQTPSTSLDGWLVTCGEWTNTDGLLRGTAGRDRFARIETVREYTDVELTCRMRITGTLHQGEIQVGRYNWLFTVRAADWSEVRLVQRGDELGCTVAGTTLTRSPGEARATRPGPLGFYVNTGGTIEIQDLSIRLPP